MDTNIVLSKDITSKIYLIRERQVILDSDLALLYEVETRVLNQAVKRNLERFPEEFMFQLTNEEFENLKSQIVTSSWGGVRKLPYVFTEHGILMISSVLNSKKAIQVNIQIMKTFIKLREMLIAHKDIALRLEEIEKKLEQHDTAFYEVFYQIKQILIQEEKPKRKIGFNAEDVERSE